MSDEYSDSDEELSSSDDDDESVSMMIDRQGNKTLGECAWNKVKIQRTQSLPFDINGLAAYSLKAPNRAELLQKCRDGRPWKNDTRTKWSGYDSVRYKNCNGSLSCPNLDCIFIQKFQERNRLRFDKSKTCTLCGAVGKLIPCLARKYTAFLSDKHVRIFHYGEHTCKPKLLKERPVDIVSTALSIDARIKPSAIQGNVILTAIRKRKSWDEVSKIVQKVIDKRLISNEKIKQRLQIFPQGEGYHAIKEYKTYTDEQDPFLIYMINENEQFVFKTSRKKMVMAREMEVEEDYILSDEYCCFDGKVQRCKNFTTLTASVYHPLLQKQIPLAIMECQSENSKNIATFWREFNNAYKEVNQVDSKFFPIGWVSDMASANFIGLQQIYGEEIMSKIKGCEFHFKQCVNKHASKCDDEKQFKVGLKKYSISTTSICIKCMNIRDYD